MEAIRRIPHDPRRLSALYSRTKAAKPSASADDSPEIVSLHRKYRIQRDRLIAWGLEWNDSENPQVNIDDSVARAGLTEIVLSVMENIKLMLDEVEDIRLEPIVGAYPLEKAPKQPKTTPWTRKERAQYADLVRDFTAAIDLLCDLKARKVPHQGAAAKSEKLGFRPDRKLPVRPPITEENTFTAFAATRETTEIPKLDYALLNMPAEFPPPYDDTGIPRPVRIFAGLRQVGSSSVNSHSSPVTPVIVEYTNYDKIYKDNGIPLPMNKLQQMSTLLTSSELKSEAILPRFLGYFEDPQHPRYGLVFELPRHLQRGALSARPPFHATVPMTLLDILQNASMQQAAPVQSSAVVFIPPLEERFRLAHSLTSGLSAMYTHSCWTHCNLSSHSIAVLPRASSTSSPVSRPLEPYDYREPVLGGFDLFSDFAIDTIRSSSSSVSHNIYRHPDDNKVTGTVSSRDHQPCYDLYSLGLILLEIGLWVPLSDIFKEKYTLQDFRTRVERIWVRRLAGKCGTAYMKAVQECLNADRLGVSSPEAMQRVYGRVKMRLARCCLLMESDSDAYDSEIEVPMPTAMRRLQHASGPPSPVNTFDSVHEPALSEAPVTRKAGQDVAGSSRGSTNRPSLSLESESSVSREAPTTFWDIPIPKNALNLWENELMYRIGKVVDKELNRRSGKVTSCSLSLDMCGDTREAAKPTIMVAVSRDWDLIEARLRRRFKNEQDTFAIAVYRGEVVRAKSDLKRCTGAARQRQPRNAFHQERPICGASIGAYVDGEHSPPVTFGGVIQVDEELYGMTVHHMLEEPDAEEDDEDEQQPIPLTRSSGLMADSRLGKRVGGSLQARPEVEENDEENEQQSAPRTTSSGYTADSRHGTRPHNALLQAVLRDEGEDGSTLVGSGSSSPEAGPDSDTLSAGSDSDDSDDGDDDDMDSIGDTPGVNPQDTRTIFVTQPALLDVPADFFPIQDDKDEDHLDSHTLGHVYASSGLRRVNHTLHGVTAKVEVDWALIKLDATRTQRANVVAGGKTYCINHSDGAYRPPLTTPVFRNKFKIQEDIYPRFIARSGGLTGLAVHSVGRTTGLSGGLIRSVGLVRFPGRATSSRVWVIRGTADSRHGGRVSGSMQDSEVEEDHEKNEQGGMGVPGDSGAWIIDNIDGKVCGSILAWSEAGRAAYMVPLDVTLDDIKKTLKACNIKLPGALPWEGVDCQHVSTTAETSPPRPAAAVRTALLSSSPARKLRSKAGDFTVGRDVGISSLLSTTHGDSRPPVTRPAHHSTGIPAYTALPQRLNDLSMLDRMALASATDCFN